MPHAIQIRQTGGPEVLTWTPIEVGEPGSGQVRLLQAAAGLNYIDVYHRTGFALKDAADAHKALEAGATSGSTILTISPSTERSLP
jgi:NADPH2:quinone reductase